MRRLKDRINETLKKLERYLNDEAMIPQDMDRFIKYPFTQQHSPGPKKEEKEPLKYDE